MKQQARACQAGRAALRKPLYCLWSLCVRWKQSTGSYQEVSHWLVRGKKLCSIFLGPDCEGLYGNQQNIKMYSTSATAVKRNPSVNAISPCKSNHLCNIQFLEEENFVFFFIHSDVTATELHVCFLVKIRIKYPQETTYWWLVQLNLSKLYQSQRQVSNDRETPT